MRSIASGRWVGLDISFGNIWRLLSRFRQLILELFQFKGSDHIL
jgi:hypothetical protein